ncbi:HD domain-containing protein [Tissierella carlieri]|uniref:helix-turn-helix domain-containing protein n=1 Tax=Tissierella carlieri TaxID=689904 RepID=UPI001C0FB4D5|nr:AraC family transcriptional regulator [Tissierella carlieri]MBU5310996.1 HD domain-containing protein [Tissierella carlieri]
MKLETIIFDSLKYIEENVNESIIIEDVAKNSGYSLYYFSRMFKKQMGLSIMEYVIERRLIKASEEIASGKKIIDVALNYGYQSHSGFTKAFKNKFGFSPILLRAFSFQINCLGGNCNMSHVFMKNTAVHATKEELYRLLITNIDENTLEFDKGKIKKAYEFACRAHNGKKRYSNDDYVTHLINVAILLAEMEASEETVIAGLLHDIISEKANIPLEEVKKEFSDGVVNIIKGVTEFNGDSDIIDEDVIMVKLAERLHNMRTIEFMDENCWKEKAKETLEIFLPIAVNLNNEKIMAELNDLSVKYI